MPLDVIASILFLKCIHAAGPAWCSFLHDHNPLSISARGSVSDFPFAFGRFYLVKRLAASEKVCINILSITDIITSHKITLADEVFYKSSPAPAKKLLAVNLCCFILKVKASYLITFQPRKPLLFR